MKITNIAIYPVKSLGSIKLDESIMTRRGLRYDRRFMLVDEEGLFISQRANPEFAVFKTEIVGDELVISTSSASIRLDLEPRSDISGTSIREVKIWSSSVRAQVVSSEIDAELSKLLGRVVSLVYMDDDSLRPINSMFDQGGEIVSFADGYPLLIVNERSLDELNKRLEDPVPVDRFRPNIVFSGSVPFEEDNWKRISIGETVFRITKPCARCAVPTIDQSTGRKTGKEPMKTLAGFRSASDVFPDNYEDFDLSGNDVLFGTNLVPESVGQPIRIGDEVVVLERR